MSDLPAAQPSSRPKFDTVGWGVLLAIGVHAIGLPLLFAIVAMTFRDPYLPIIVVANVGWAQILYMPIAILVLVRRQQRAMLKGVLIVTGLAFLITSTCTLGMVRFG